MTFERLDEFVTEITTTNSKNKKAEILKKYDDLKELFIRVYDSINITYGVTSKNIIKKKSLGTLTDITGKDVEYDLFQTLDLLVKRKFTGNDAIKLVNTLVKNNPKYEDYIYNIIDRNLKARIDAKLINSVWEGLIDEFPVSRAETYWDYADGIDFTTDPYYASRKCNGVRCVAFIDGKNITFKSRTGKEYFTLDILKTEILKVLSKTSIKKTVLDGEVCLITENGEDDFKGIVSQVRKKNHTITNPKFMVFDMITHEEFEAAHSDKTFKERYENLVWAIGDESKHVECLNQIKIDTLQKFKQFMDKSRELKWEGIVLRRMASLYEGKRIKDILKAKDFKDAEYTVVSVVNTVMRHIVDGLEVESPMLGKVMIKHKENLVGVGSGWSIEERLHYYEHPEEIIGKVITVSYFDESQDKDGNCSLQHPTLVCIHGDRRET